MRRLLDKFTAWLVSFGIEVYLHILVSIILAGIVVQVCVHTGGERELGCALGAFISFGLGYIKELYDAKTTGVFEAKDIASNLVGIIIAFVLFV